MKRWLIIGLLVIGIFHAVPKQADEAKSNQDDANKFINTLASSRLLKKAQWVSS